MDHRCGVYFMVPVSVRRLAFHVLLLPTMVCRAAAAKTFCPHAIDFSDYST
jgi:hypothetical protein